VVHGDGGTEEVDESSIGDCAEPRDDILEVSAWTLPSAHQGVKPRADGLDTIPDRSANMLAYLQCVASELDVVVQQGEDRSEWPDNAPHSDIAELRHHLRVVGCGQRCPCCLTH